MKIHLVRHAEAIGRTGEIADDHRYLTCRGRTRFRRVAATLEKQGIEPDYILTSPLVRAVQTADILAEKLHFSGDLLIEPLLAGGLTMPVLRDLLASHTLAGEIVLVGHEPDMGLLLGALLATDSPCSIKKGGVVSLKLDLKHPSMPVEFISLVTGGGKLVTNRTKALERLQS